MSNEIISKQNDLFTEAQIEQIRKYVANGTSREVAICFVTGRTLLDDGSGHVVILEEPQQVDQKGPISPDLSQVSPPTVRERPRGFFEKTFSSQKVGFPQLLGAVGLDFLSLSP